MNDRIIQLAKKSLLTEWFWLDPTVHSPEDYLSEKEAIEDFAKLIIKECAKIADERQFKHRNNYPISIAIEEHFGVE